MCLFLNLTLYSSTPLCAGCGGNLLFTFLYAKGIQYIMTPKVCCPIHVSFFPSLLNEWKAGNGKCKFRSYFWEFLMSTHTYIFVGKLENYQYFAVEKKSALSAAMVDTVCYRHAVSQDLLVL